MLVKSDGAREEKIVQNLIADDEKLRRQHEIFEAKMEFKQKLIETRKSESLTQKDLSRMTGLSQQAVSRLEKGARPAGVFLYQVKIPALEPPYPIDRATQSAWRSHWMIRS